MSKFHRVNWTIVTIILDFFKQCIFTIACPVDWGQKSIQAIVALISALRAFENFFDVWTIFTVNFIEPSFEKLSWKFNTIFLYGSNLGKIGLDSRNLNFAKKILWGNCSLYSLLNLIQYKLFPNFWICFSSELIYLFKLPGTFLR